MSAPSSEPLGWDDQFIPETGNPLSALDAYDNKCVFLTGATGFVGKVIVEKMLRSTNVRKVFLLVRPRKGSTADARMMQEIVGSEIFTRCKTEMGEANFQTMARAKLHAIAGELTMEKCGISDEDLALLYREVDSIIHCAAIVDFNERLDRAIELNTMGSLRMLQIAKNCAHCSAFVHVSTCYVNSNRSGYIEEKLYPLGFDIDEMLKRIQSLPSSDLEKIADTGILREWPNTYTFTKAMTEQLLVKNRGNVPLAIVRPSIVGCAWREPVPGWVDVISAAGAVYLAAGLGVLRFLPGSPKSIADVVPVDYVANSILSAIPTIWGKNAFMVSHSATGAEFPMTWELPATSMVKWFQTHPLQARVAPSKFRFIQSPQEYQIQFFLNYSVPSSILNVLAPFGTKAHQATAAQFSKLVFKVRVLVESFKHFVSHEWLFDNSSCRAMFANLVEGQKAVFPLDLSQSMDWVAYNNHFAYGMSKFILREEITDIKTPALSNKYVELHTQHHNYFTPSQPGLLRKLAPDTFWAGDMMKAHTAAGYPPVRPVREMSKIILACPAVVDALKHEVAHNLHGSNSMEKAEGRARAIIERMFGTTKLPAIAGLGVTLRKLLKRLYQSVRVDTAAFAKIKEIAQNGPLVFTPTHRSYVDFLIVSYVCFVCQLPIPFIAAGEDFLGILFIRWIFRLSGAFFLRRSFLGEEDKLYSAIFKEYVAQVLGDGQSLEFFIEGTRSRSGKMLQPKLGLLSIVNAAYFDGQIEDVTYVPITINYEKTLEGEMYSSELEGSKKMRESLKNLLAASSSLLNVNFGTISVVVGQPLSLKGYTEALTDEVRVYGRLNEIQTSPFVDDSKHGGTQADSSREFDPFQNKDDRRYLARRLAYRIIHELTKGNEVCPTHMVATLLLMYRQGVTTQNLASRVAWLADEIALRGGRLCNYEAEYKEGKHGLLESALTLLGRVVKRHRVDFVEPAILNRQEYSNMLVLGHYRNKLVHYFYPEGLWAVALYSFGNEQIEQGVGQAALIKEVRFLHSLLSREFTWKENPDQAEDFEVMLQGMLAKGLFRLTNGQKVEVASSGETHFSFLCALYWPFVDSYYVAVMILFSLQPDREMEEKLLLQRTQWLATTLYHESMLCFYESCSTETLSNAFDVLSKWGVIELTTKKYAKSSSKFAKAKQGTYKSVKLTPAFQKEEAVQQLLDRIGRLRKQPARTSAHPTGPLFRRNLVADIPILAKM
mmetsp:Transcript_15877/g.31108  ORF Transcript_15877/g.31108 Transcript_15877/m.31108 type:complete len:1225 (+) Transcript_15877:37-3711(+)